MKKILPLLGLVMSFIVAPAHAQVVCTDLDSVFADSTLNFSFSTPVCAGLGQPYTETVSFGIRTRMIIQGTQLNICRVIPTSFAWNSTNTLNAQFYYNGQSYGMNQEIVLDDNGTDSTATLCLALTGSITELTANRPMLNMNLKVYTAAQNCQGQPIAVIPITAMDTIHNVLPLEVVTQLTDCPTLQNQVISGNVVYTNPNTSAIDTAACGTVYLYTIQAGLPNLADSVVLTDTAPFVYLATTGAQYIAYYVPCDSLVDSLALMPTYFQNHAFWADADTLQAGSYHLLYALADSAGLQGPGVIGGSIAEGRAMGVPGVSVFLTTPTGQLLKHRKTDANGSYTFNNLPYGGYLVVPDMAGIQSTPYPVQLSAADTGVFVANFSFEDDEIIPFIVHVGITENSVQAGLVVWPNPAHNMATVLFTADTPQNIYLQVTDMGGKTLLQQTASAQTGKNNIMVNLTTLPAGIYHLRVQGTGFTHIQKLVLVK